MTFPQTLREFGVIYPKKYMTCQKKKKLCKQPHRTLLPSGHEFVV